MKTQLLVLLFGICFFSFSPIAIYSQDQKKKNIEEELPYRPFDEFDNDTIAFIEYNFVKRSSKAYKGMTVDEILKLVYFPYIYIGSYGNLGNSCTSFEIPIIQEDRRATSDGKAMYLGIIIGLDPHISKSEYGIIRNKNMVYEHFKDWKVSGAYTEQRIIDHAKRLRKYRKEGDPRLNAIQKDTEEVKKQLKEKNRKKASIK